MTNVNPDTLLPTDATWVGVMLLLVAGLFLAAIVVGLVGRSIAPEAYDDTVRTEEPDGNC